MLSLSSYLIPLVLVLILGTCLATSASLQIPVAKGNIIHPDATPDIDPDMNARISVLNNPEKNFDEVKIVDRDRLEIGQIDNDKLGNKGSKQKPIPEERINRKLGIVKDAKSSSVHIASFSLCSLLITCLAVAKVVSDQNKYTRVENY